MAADSIITSTANPAFDGRQRDGTYIVAFFALGALVLFGVALWFLVTTNLIGPAIFGGMSLAFVFLAVCMRIMVVNARQERINFDPDAGQVTFEHFNTSTPFRFPAQQVFPISALSRIRDTGHNSTLFFNETLTSPRTRITVISIHHAPMVWTLATAAGVSPHRPWWTKPAFIAIILLALIGPIILSALALIIGILIWMPRP